MRSSDSADRSVCGRRGVPMAPKSKFEFGAMIVWCARAVFGLFWVLRMWIVGSVLEERFEMV